MSGLDLAARVARELKGEASRSDAGLKRVQAIMGSCPTIAAIAGQGGYRMEVTKRSRWTEQEDRQLRYLYEQGASVVDIAQFMERTASAVRSRIFDKQLKRKDRSEQ